MEPCIQRSMLAPPASATAPFVAITLFVTPLRTAWSITMEPARVAVEDDSSVVVRMKVDVLVTIESRM